MIRNYIQFEYDEFGTIYAKISKDGEIEYIRNINKVFDLIDIIEKYGYTINGEMRIVKNAREIISDYNKKNSINHNKKKKKRLKVYGKIDKKMKVSRKNKSANKKVVALLLAATTALTTAAFLSKQDQPGKSDNTLEGRVIATEPYDDIEISTPEELTNETTNYQETPTEINEMINEEETFHFSYEDRTNSENINNVDQYDDIFKKYANMYGLDVRLLKAIACQESGGNHYDNIGNGPAEGIMQIEKSVHIGELVSAYNFETKEIDFFEITEENLQDIDFNIRVGAMELRNAMESFNYNIPQATQAYNFGIGGMNQTLAICSRNIGQPQELLEKTPTNSAWLNYREPLNMGDSNYIEHVFSYLPNHSKLTVLDRNNTEHSVIITNDYTLHNRK